MSKLAQYIERKFGVNEDTFQKAITISPSSRGYIMGAISELMLADHLRSLGFEVLRIKEKPRGGNNAKTAGAKGDFYIRPAGSSKDEWLVIESKGLKSNSEIRKNLTSPQLLFAFLSGLSHVDRDAVYADGLRRYENKKQRWSVKHPAVVFPPFRWNSNTPGPCTASLSGIWASDDALRTWIEAQPAESFSEAAYRKGQGPIAILETHQPSTRIGPITHIKQAAPLITDFNIMAVDLFLRTGRHEFIFMNAADISHSPTSPEHLYQNYIIDVLVTGLKGEICIHAPWYADIRTCIEQTQPVRRQLDETQLDTREIEST